MVHCPVSISGQQFTSCSASVGLGRSGRRVSDDSRSASVPSLCLPSSSSSQNPLCSTKLHWPPIHCQLGHCSDKTPPKFREFAAPSTGQGTQAHGKALDHCFVAGSLGRLPAALPAGVACVGTWDGSRSRWVQESGEADGEGTALGDFYCDRRTRPRSNVSTTPATGRAANSMSSPPPSL